MIKRNIVDCLRTGKAPSAQGRVGTVAEQRQRAADYIEELEAKLAQAVEALEKVDDEYYRQDGIILYSMRDVINTLAKIKGETNDQE